MRWSWPAFVAGAAVGVVVCLWLVAAPEPATLRRATSAAPRRADEAAPSVAAVVHEPRRTRSVAPAPPRGRDPVGRSEAGDAPAPRADAPPVRDGIGDGRQGVEVVASGEGVEVGVRPASFSARGARIRDVAPVRVGASTAQALARARRAADAMAAEGRAESADLVGLLRSCDDAELEAAIGLAARADPPRIDLLLKTASDAHVGGSLRATALAAAADVAPSDRLVAAAVVDLTSDRNVDVRRTAIELLPRVGPAAADRVLALLKSGDYAGALLDPLAGALAASDRALDFLLGSPEPGVAFAVLAAVRVSPPVDARLAARLPDVVRNLLGTPEMLDHAAVAFGLLADVGHVVWLRSVAVSTGTPTTLRLAAVEAAVEAPACADGRAALLAATLSDGRSPVELLRAVLERVPRSDVADGGVKAAITALAETHPNQWLREDARAKLQASPPPAADGGLRILSGIYGKEGKTIDVSNALASMVVGGRLVVEAGNALAGDPLVGTVKELAVVYVWKGERRTRLIEEYETLTLP